MICISSYELTLDGLFAVGSYSPANVKAELFNFGTGAWTTVDDYPFTSSQGVTDFDMIYISETFSYFVIGGKSPSLSQIAQFKDGAWFDAGHLNSARAVSI